MKRNILLVLLLTASSLCAIAQIPGTISYQGYLTKANGSPADDGVHTVKFDFYDGSTKVMERGPISVTTDKGLFTTIIGSGSANNAAFTPAQWTTQLAVKMTVDGSELSNEVTLTSVPYAIVAGAVNAANVAGTLTTANIPNLDGSKITSGTISGSLIGTGVNATSISAGTIDNARLDADVQDLADGSLSGSKVGSGISATNVTTGTLPNTVLDAELQDLADGTLTSLNVDGFSKLGSASPLLQVKILRGTTVADNSDTVVAHGLGASNTGKIVSISAWIESTAGTFYVTTGTPAAAGAGLEYYVVLSGANIRIKMTASNSTNLYSKPYKLLVTYEQ